MTYTQALVGSGRSPSRSCIGVSIPLCVPSVRRPWSHLPSGDERVVAVGRCERNLLEASFAKQLLEFPGGELLTLGEKDHVHRERGRCKRGVPRVLKEHLVQVDPPSGRKTLETLPSEEATALPTPVMEDIAQEVSIVP